MSDGPHIDYEALADSALRSAMRAMVRDVMARVAKTGLPGEHHFYIAFDTTAPGVGISKRLKEKYPNEMTIVLQHRFWDLAVSDDRFEVKLTFDGIPERLAVPYQAIKVFFDPSVPYGLQFDEASLSGEARQAGPQVGPMSADMGAAAQPDKKPRTPRKLRTTKSGESDPQTPPLSRVPGKPTLVTSKADEPNPANDTKVISLDKFRKK